MKSHGNGDFFLSLFEVFSRGRLSLKSSNPMEDAILEPRMLSDERDLIRMRDGARRLFKLGQHQAVSDIVERVTVGTTGIDLRSFPVDDDAALDSWMLSDAADCSHPAGTCRVGRSGDVQTVVDPDCRVVDLQNLRVADASIIPADCRANLHLTVVLIGEYVAQKIKNQTSWK